jgi:hypothetical protein
MPSPKYPHARLSLAQDEILAIAITRRSVVKYDIRPLLDTLRPLVATRETAEIPAIRSDFLDVTAEFPDWFHFVEKVGDTVWHVLRLLCRGHREQTRPEMIGWPFDDHEELFRQINVLLGYMNALYDRLGLPEAMNERLSQEIAQRIDGALQ